jgi:hypothetical protein
LETTKVKQPKKVAAKTVKPIVKAKKIAVKKEAPKPV